MTEWALTNPWTAFFMVAILLTIVENIVKRFKLCKEDAYEELLDKAMQSNKELRSQVNNIQRTLAEMRQQRDREGETSTRRQRDMNYDDLRRAYEGMNGGFSKDPTWDEIKAKYRKDMKAMHPDKVRARGGSQAEIDKATRQTQELNKLYNIAKARHGK